MNSVVNQLLTLFSPSAELLNEITEKEWETLVLVAREGGVLGRLYYKMADQSLLDALPEYPKKHMLAASLYADRQAQQVRFESQLLVDTLGEEYRQQHMFLKGAAYVLSDDPVHRGRTFSDIDLLVRKSQISQVEQKLMVYGWFQDEKSDYDQHYYRNWIHEIPPLSHAVRGTVLDLHHNIVPPVSGRAPDTELLWQELITKGSGVSYMCPAGLSLHSLVHLFFQEEFSHGFRDLSDLNILFTHHGTEAGYWETLLSLAHNTGFGRETFFAVRYCQYFFNTQIPQFVTDSLEQYKPTSLKLTLLDWAFKKILVPHHSSCKESGFNLANNLLFVRGHLLKMPLHILLYHTFNKTVQGLNFLLTGRSAGHTSENKQQEQ